MALRSRKVENDDAFGSLSNTRIVPARSSTKIRLLPSGA